MMPATERVEISTARILKDDNRITSSRVQSNLEREAGALVNVGEVQGPNARFFRSGRTGEGAEQLSIEQRKRLANGLSEAMKRFEYEGPELD